MVKFSPQDIRATMDKAHYIRNMSVIGQWHHGKTTLCDSLIAAAGVISQEAVGDVRFLDNRTDEAERGITIKSSVISLCYNVNEDILQGYKGESCGNAFLCNLIDSPGHSDFSAEVSAALRVTDGALVVVDCMEGVSLQTENILRQALAERVKPVLIVNKIDKCFQFNGELVYKKISEIIDQVNSVIATYEDPAFGDIQICPLKGNVAFSAGIHGWAFTLRQFARLYASRSSNIDETVLLKKLWGDNYCEHTTNKWTKENTGSPRCSRGFVQFCYKPIKQVYDSCMGGQGAKKGMWKAFKSMGITIKSDDKELTGKALLQRVMQAWLPASKALLELMIFNLPSPLTAQIYRVENLYEGPLDDVYATAIKNCDPQGPLMVYISKMIPAAEMGRFFAFGRVLAGTVKPGSKVRIMGPNYVPGKKKDLYEKSVQQTVIWTGKKAELVEDVPCGNVVGLGGIEPYITKSATLASDKHVKAYPIRAMQFSVSPIVRVAVACKNAADLPKLVEGLKRLAKSDPLVACTEEETGEHTVAGAGELHLEICLKDLQDDYMGGAEIVQSDPIVSYRETVLMRSRRVMSMSPNKHNRLYMEARPLEDGLANAIDEGRFGARDDRPNVLAEDFGWNRENASKLWCFGPDGTGPNMVVDVSRGVGYLNEVRDSVVCGFQLASKEGALAGERLRGICFELCDAVIPAQAVHRGHGQVTQTAERVIHASQLAATPRLMEPVYLLEIQAPTAALGGVYEVLGGRRGVVLDVVQRDGGAFHDIRAYLPVVESFGFASEIRAFTSGAALHHCLSFHWKMIDSDPLEDGSLAAAQVAKIRARKGMKLQVSPLPYYED